MTKFILFLKIIIIILTGIIHSQEINISGRIINSLTGKPIENADVIIQNSNNGSATDSSGKFFIRSERRNIFLKVSHVGFKPISILISESVTDTIIRLIPLKLRLREITVSAELFFIKGISSEVTSGQIRRLTDLSKDAVRSLSLFPGVSTNNEATSLLNIRGGSPDENLFLIDGAEVHNFYHVKEYPMAGVSILNGRMIKKIDFSAGGFPASYGGALSSLINAEYDHDYFDKFSGVLDISMTDINVVINGPLSKASSYVIGYRKSFINQMLRIFTSGRKLPDISFYDIQGIFLHKFSALNKIYINAIYSKDSFSESPDSDIQMKFTLSPILGKKVKTYETVKEYDKTQLGYDNLLLSLGASNFFSDFISVKSVLSYYKENERGYIIKNSKGSTIFSSYPGLFNYTYDDCNISKSFQTVYITFQNRIRLYLRNNIKMHLGFEYRRISYYGCTLTNGLNKIKTNTTGFSDTSFTIIPYGNSQDFSYQNSMSVYDYSGYFQSHINIYKNLDFNIGGRIEHTGINDDISLSPRVYISYRSPLKLAIKGAWGYYYQAPSAGQMQITDAGALNIGNQEAEHFIFEIYREFKDEFKARIDFYYKRYSNLYLAERLTDGSIYYGNKIITGNGFSRGIDVQFSGFLFGFYFNMVYGYLVAKEKPDGNTGKYYYRFTDQTHTFAADLFYKFNNYWKFDIKFFYGSGYAYTPSFKFYNGKYSAYEWQKGDKNSAHFPAYFRTDLRIKRNFFLFNYPISLYLNIMNILNKKNIYCFKYNYDIDTGEPVIETRELLPIIFALGFTLEIK